MATVELRIGPADHGRSMSLEEFRWAEEQPGYLYELARGVLEVSEVPADAHGQVVDNLHEAISAYRRDHPRLIRRVGHGSDIRLIIPELESDRHPDLALVFHGAPLTDRGRQQAELVCEVLSPGARARRRDYDEKSEEYLQLRIRQYWIIDPLKEQVTVRTRQETPEGPAWSDQVFKGDEVIVSVLLPGFQMKVSSLWTDAGAEEDDAPAPGG
jgi:Uma2 family endonuclease